MSLSFEDSLKQNAANNIATTKNENIVAPAVMSVDENIDSPSIMTLDAMPMMMAAYAGDDGNWTQHKNYEYYNTFSDDNISNVDDEKNIT